MQNEQNRRVWANRVEVSTVQAIDKIAMEFGFSRITGGLDHPRVAGDTGRLLDAIASGELKLIRLV
jgi:hypothetical protein